MSPVALLEAFVAVALLAIAAVRWPRPIVMSLPFLVILNGLSIRRAGFSMHLDQLAACLLVVPLTVSILIGTRRFRSDGTVWWLAAILAQNILATMLNSPARSYSLAQCVNVASVWVIYLLLLNFLDTRKELEIFLNRVLWAAVVASAIGIAAFVLAVSGVPVGGADVSRSAAERLTTAYGAYGTMVEPNILGSFSAAQLVLAFGVLVALPQPSVADVSRRLLRWVLALTAVSLVLTFTRAAWLSAIGGLAWVAIVGARSTIRTRSWRVIWPLGAGVILVGLLLLLPGNAGTLLRFKIFNLVNLASQTAIVRIVTYTMAFQQTLEHPFIGWGTFTFAPLVAQGGDFQQFDNWRNLWIGNYLLLAAHDTGLVGLGLWVGMLGTIVGRSVTTIRALSVTDPASASRILALTASVATLLVAFLATSGFSLGYSWLIVGLLGAYRRVATEEPPSVAQASPSAPDGP